MMIGTTVIVAQETQFLGKTLMANLINGAGSIHLRSNTRQDRKLLRNFYRI